MAKSIVPKVPARVDNFPLTKKLLACGHQRINQGKVREIFNLPGHPDHMLVVVTDRLSAYDVVLSREFPLKGYSLNVMDHFSATVILKDFLHDIVASGADIDKYLSPPLRKDAELQARGKVVLKLKMLPIECIARGYLFGGAWDGYQENREYCGITFAEGLREGHPIHPAIFTPTTKEQEGHDEPLNSQQVEKQYSVKDYTLSMYEAAREHGRLRGVIVVDTKGEIGIDGDGNRRWGDERVTPDSSRFWPADKYTLGGPIPPSMDKQYVRDYLKTVVTRFGPFPKLKPQMAEQRAAGHEVQIPPEVVVRTSEIYPEVARIWTGVDLEVYMRDNLGIKDFRLKI